MKTNDTVLANRPQIRAPRVLFYGCTDLAFCPYEKGASISICEGRRSCGNGQEDKRFMYMNGATIDLGEMFVNISNNIICKPALGRKYKGEDGSQSFGNLSRTAMELMGAFCFEDLFPYLKWLDVLTGFSARLRTTSNALNAVLDQIIEEHQKSDGGDQSDKKDFVDILLNLQKNGMLDINLTQENIKAILLDMVMGGTDTTSTTMEWAMAELVKNPNVMKKAQEEVRRVVGEKLKVDETDIDQMDVLKCYDTPPGTGILINAWAIQRDPKLWDRPEEFLPERFANNSIDFKGHHEQFIPFGMGRKGCPGISFAIIEAEYLLANLLYCFDWEFPDGVTVNDLDMSEVYMLVIRKKIPLCLVPVLHSPS
ncbi:hypothetical protein SO802_020324 [Lithocarpus litseifolius]|uniref:Cytochrome P450 71A1 n=1 Tax=Lithocarpus litseifolius TaxID=425828 RepID=A0AAW2CD86_9ROSI